MALGAASDAAAGAGVLLEWFKATVQSLEAARRIGLYPLDHRPMAMPAREAASVSIGGV